MKTALRQDLLAGALVGALAFIGGSSHAAEASGKKTFTILHANDLHSNFIGLGPASDYTPFTLNDDETRGGYARMATLIAQRKAARKGQGPVLVLCAGDYSMGTAFGAAMAEGWHGPTLSWGGRDSGRGRADLIAPRIRARPGSRPPDMGLWRRPVGG